MRASFRFHLLTHYAIPTTVQFNFRACTVWLNIHDAYTFFVITKKTEDWRRSTSSTLAQVWSILCVCTLTLYMNYLVRTKLLHEGVSHWLFFHVLTSYSNEFEVVLPSPFLSFLFWFVVLCFILYVKVIQNKQKHLIILCVPILIGFSSDLFIRDALNC